MKKLTTSLAVLGLGISLYSGEANAIDSFFDVFFDVEYNADTNGPTISAKGTSTDLSTTPSRSTSVDIEIVALSLVSSAGPEGSTRHEATLSYNLGSSGEDRGRQQQTTAYAELDIACWPKDASGAPRCEILQARASDRSHHRGHVTVLK